MRKRLSLPSPAMAIAVVALFAALGGTSYAAFMITGAHVKDGSLTGADIRDGSLTARDLKGGPVKGGPHTRWVLVNAAGEIEAQSGGFKVLSGYVANPPGAAGNVYIDAGEDLTDKGIGATLALQNATDQNGDAILNGRAPGADNNPEFAGEISATRCAITGVVTCAPPGTNTSSVFVVSPRNSDGTVTDAGTRKRFYATITG